MRRPQKLEMLLNLTHTRMKEEKKRKIRCAQLFEKHRFGREDHFSMSIFKHMFECV